MAAPLLALRDIRTVFADQVLIGGASFALAQGDRLCLVGRNGSGKSTLLRIAAGLVDADGGEIFRQPGTRIAYLEQVPDFGGAKTVIDYATSGGAEAYMAAAALDELKLSPTADPSKLSGGEGRKAALARVLAEEPDILLLDEPTNHLDLPSIEWLEDRLSQFRGAFILISHDRHLVETCADRLWLVADGKVAPYDGDLDDYRKWLLDPARRVKPMVTDDEVITETPRIQIDKKEARRLAAQKREQIAPLKKKVQAAEKEIARLQKQIETLDMRLATPEVASAPSKTANIAKERADTLKALAAAEEIWLNASAAYEEAASA